MTDPTQTFLDKLHLAVENRELIKLTLSNARNKSSDLQNIIITLAELKKGLRLNFVYRHATRDITKNYEISEGIAIIKQSLENQFLNADIFTNSENIRLTGHPSGKVKMSVQEPTLQPVTVFHHDRIKTRLIQAEGNIYLRELGITNAAWEIRREMSDKFRQINRYIELLEPEIREIQLPPDYHVVDMGSGKGYLTFALYDYLTNRMGRKPRMTGVEFRKDLVQSCNQIAAIAGFDGLGFSSGTIQEAILERIDILIALHACDTATDDAIYRGIRAGAALIVVAPCCHKQVRKDMDVTGELGHLARFGILRERQAEILTDTIRALLLEAHGYKTKVFEFISTEHTPKNVMIVGRKTGKAHPEGVKLLADIRSLRQSFGISRHYLEELLKS